MNKIPGIKKVNKIGKAPSLRVQKNRVAKYIKTTGTTARVRKTRIADGVEKKYDTRSKRAVYRKAGADSFPGRIKNSDRYADGTPGLFVTEVKGVKGKYFIEKGVKAAIDAFMNNG